MNPNIEAFEPPIKDRVESLLMLSGIVNQFIDVKRATLRNGRYETDGEHTLHLQSLAVAYAAEYHPDLELGKVSLYALVHDFIEVYAGDTNSLKATAKEIAAKTLRERAALNRLRNELGASWPSWVNLIEKYELLIDKEARFIKTFDKCDPGFSHLESKGKVLLALGVVSRDMYESHNTVVLDRMGQYAGEFPDVLAIREELQSRIASVLYGDV